MFEGDEELDINPDDVSDEDNLLFNTFPGMRVFVLNDLDKTNIWGVLLEESDDSFLVGLPATMFTNEDKTVRVQSFGPVAYIRMQKSAILSTSYTFEPYEDVYRNYLNTKGAELYPEVSEYLEEGEAQAEPAEATIVGPTDTDVSLSKDASQGTQVLGMTDEELEQYLQEKYNNGALANGSGKKQ